VIKKNTAPSETLHKLVCKAKKHPEIVIQPDSTFKDLHIDSLEAVSIIIALEDELDIEIDDRDLKQIVNMGAFIHYLDNKVAQKRISQFRFK
jgi:acyl carrier protein